MHFKVNIFKKWYFDSKFEIKNYESMKKKYENHIKVFMINPS